MTHKEPKLPYIYIYKCSSCHGEVQVKKAAWSTNKTSDLPKILRYDFFLVINYCLVENNPYSIFYHLNSGCFSMFLSRALLLKEINRVKNGHDHLSILNNNSSNMHF